jgi:hypothetical protein
MAEAKIEIKVGAVSFSGEGEGKWVSEQLDKVLARLQELASVAPATSETDQGETLSRPAHSKVKGTLAAFLSANNAKDNKRRKFLGTALWLQDTEKKARLTTREVKNALSQHSQGSVGNASVCLSQNVRQGFLAKEGKQFYVTDEGRAEIAK